MSQNKDLKVKQVEELTELFKNAESFVIVDYKGLTVDQDTALRNRFRQAGVSYHVFKNRLVKIALNNLGMTEFDDDLNGPSAFAIATKEISAPAKIALEAIDEFKKMAVKSGMVSNKRLDETGVKSLATLPSKDVLIAQLLGMLQSPVRGLAGTLNSIVASLPRVISAIAQKA